MLKASQNWCKYANNTIYQQILFSEDPSLLLLWSLSSGKVTTLFAPFWHAFTQWFNPSEPLRTKMRMILTFGWVSGQFLVFSNSSKCSLDLSLLSFHTTQSLEFFSLFSLWPHRPMELLLFTKAQSAHSWKHTKMRSKPSSNKFKLKLSPLLLRELKLPTKLLKITWPQKTWWKLPLLPTKPNPSLLRLPEKMMPRRLSDYVIPTDILIKIYFHAHK